MFRKVFRSTRDPWILSSSHSARIPGSTPTSHPFDFSKTKLKSRSCPNLTHQPSAATTPPRPKPPPRQSSDSQHTSSPLRYNSLDSAKPAGPGRHPLPPSSSNSPNSSASASTGVQDPRTDDPLFSSTLLLHPMSTTTTLLPSCITHLNAILVSLQNYYYIHGPPGFDANILDEIEEWRPKLRDAKREWERVRQWEDKMGWGLGFGVGSGVRICVGSGLGVVVRDSVGSGLRGAMDEEEFGVLVGEVMGEIEGLIVEVKGAFWGSVVKL